MSGAAVTVVDRVPYSAVVSPEQAVAYCRRVLPTWEERTDGPVITFRAPDGVDVKLGWTEVPANPDFRDYARRMSELCDDLVRLGVAARPSDVLRAMAETAV